MSSLQINPIYSCQLFNQFSNRPFTVPPYQFNYCLLSAGRLHDSSPQFWMKGEIDKLIILYLLTISVFFQNGKISLFLQFFIPKQKGTLSCDRCTFFTARWKRLQPDYNSQSIFKTRAIRMLLCILFALEYLTLLDTLKGSLETLRTLSRIVLKVQVQRRKPISLAIPKQMVCLSHPLLFITYFH